MMNIEGEGSAGDPVVEDVKQGEDAMVYILRVLSASPPETLVRCANVRQALKNVSREMLWRRFADELAVGHPVTGPHPSVQALLLYIGDALRFDLGLSVPMHTWSSAVGEPDLAYALVSLGRRLGEASHRAWPPEVPWDQEAFGRFLRQRDEAHSIAIFCRDLVKTRPEAVEAHVLEEFFARERAANEAIRLLLDRWVTAQTDLRALLAERLLLDGSPAWLKDMGVDLLALPSP